jgi:hypothetical protein
VNKEIFMQPDFIIKKKKSSSVHNVGMYKKKGYTTMGAMSAPNQIIKKETLYNDNHDLGNGVYNVQIMLSQNDDLVISA